MNRAYARLRLIKSAEELDWHRIGARLSDLSIDALVKGIKPGLTERDLGQITESAYQKWGGVNVIHFFAANPMAAPQYGVPRQYPSTRKVQAGDVISTEITASFWDYGGQGRPPLSGGGEVDPPVPRPQGGSDALAAPVPPDPGDPKPSACVGGAADGLRDRPVGGRGRAPYPGVRP